MSQKASPTAIGAFVLGAIALVIASLLIFGSGKFLREVETYSLFFTGDTKGLSVGSPATFRGVKIGTVTQVSLISDISTDEVFVEVIVDIFPDTFREVQSQPGVDLAAGKPFMEHLINDLGLRAKLAVLSLVTGQLHIQFDYFPKTPVHLFGFNSRYPEFPTLPSTMDELQVILTRAMRQLDSLPIKKLTEQLVEIVEGINNLISSHGLRESAVELHSTLVNTRQLTAKLNERVTPLADSLTQTSAQAGATFANISTMLKSKRGKVVRLAESLERAADQTTELLGHSDNVLSDIDGRDLQILVQEISDAARAIRALANYLERHPEAIFRGKK